MTTALGGGFVVFTERYRLGNDRLASLMNSVNNHLATRLRALRGSRSLYSIAEESGISRPVLHRYENGRIPTDEQLKALAKYYKIPYQELKFLAFEDIFPAGSEERRLLFDWARSSESE